MEPDHAAGPTASLAGHANWAEQFAWHEPLSQHPVNTITGETDFVLHVLPAVWLPGHEHPVANEN